MIYNLLNFGTQVALLHGQRDHAGKAKLLKFVLGFVAVIAVVCALAFIIFAPGAAALYNITDTEQAALAVKALQIFSLCVPVRSLVIVYFRYLKVTGLTVYATLIGALDGFLSLLPIIFIMTHFMGISGIWWGYTVNAGFLLIFIMICNVVIMIRSAGRYKNPLLLENGSEGEVLADVTIPADKDDISGLASHLQSICEESGMDGRDAMHCALAVEEMAVYAADRGNAASYMDILVRRTDGKIEIDFRSLGDPFDSMDRFAEDMEPNIKLLRKLSKSISFEYNMGMNMTHISLP